MSIVSRWSTLTRAGPLLYPGPSYRKRGDTHKTKTPEIQHRKDSIETKGMEGQRMDSACTYLSGQRQERSVKDAALFLLMTVPR